MLPRTVHATVALVLFACHSFAQHIEVDLVAEELVKSRLESGLVKPRERQPAIKSLFEDVGCTPQEQPIDKNSANVFCVLPGETTSRL